MTSMSSVEVMRAATAAIQEATEQMEEIEEMLREKRGEIKRPDLRLVADEGTTDA
jgi:hypothetical protein